jgi:hypothetical protein
MADVPSFTKDGVLPAGDYELSLEELKASLLVTGRGHDSSEWDSTWRLKLVENLAILVGQLTRVGIKEIYINGSFVEDKDHPNDIDGYFTCDAHDLPSLITELNKLDPNKVWDWNVANRRPYRNYPKPQLPMWHHYRVEFYPHYHQFSGIRDEHGQQQTFPAAFRRARRNGIPKGIVKIKITGENYDS